MSLGEDKMRILELLWAQGQPMTLKDIAQKCGLKVAATNMHLLRLKRTGQVLTPKHGYYAITESGKEALGLPKVDKALASKILSHVSADKAFHFYTGVHQYTHIIAHDLAEFADKVQKIDVKSIEFHIPRKDFEHWVHSLGDTELVRRLELIRGMCAHGEDLRTRIYETVKHRLDELKRIHG
jgi:Mn-dependent DtxR family transcriptional regulator